MRKRDGVLPYNYKQTSRRKMIAQFKKGEIHILFGCVQEVDIGRRKGI